MEGNPQEPSELQEPQEPHLPPIIQNPADREYTPGSRVVAVGRLAIEELPDGKFAWYGSTPDGEDSSHIFTREEMIAMFKGVEHGEFDFGLPDVSSESGRNK